MSGGKQKRLSDIIEILRERNGSSIKQLSSELNVTEMTIRRDLEVLRLNNIISLIHGAAIYNPETERVNGEPVYHIIEETGVMDAEKNRIGKAAAKLVAPGDVVFVDVGTTTVRLVSYLPVGLPISLTCFSMNALLAVQKKKVKNLNFGGGCYHTNTQMFESAESVQMIRRMRANKAFISAAGIDRKLGLTCTNQYEVDTKSACLDSALQKILLADSSKFGCIRPVFFGELGQMDAVITDSGLSQEWREALRELGIQLTIV